MSKLLTVMQGNHGIVINVQMTTEKKEPIVILDTDTVFAHIQRPDNSCEDVLPENITIIDRNKGLIRIVLSEYDTSEEGFYQIFMGMEAEEYKIDANKTIQYYVNAKHQIGEH